jgi:hypothetical protein
MKVIDINGVEEVNNVDDLHTVLARRCEGGFNSYWLSHGEEEHPTLSLLVKGDLATLSYFPKEFDAGFRSVGALPHLNAGETTTFSISKYPADDVDVLNDAVLPFSVALEAAKDFFNSKDLPQSVEWLRL